MVECQLPKLDVAGSNPVSRSITDRKSSIFIRVEKGEMRIKRELVEHISKKIVESLVKKDLIIWDEGAEKLEARITDVITQDLMVEDNLNEEVKTLLDSRTKEYERDMMDYGRVFQLVKSRLARERGLIF